MNIVAKFKCDKVTKFEGTVSEEISLRAVYESDGEDNKSWSAMTPSGEARLTITNTAAHGAFEEGKFYKLTFEPFS